MYCDSVDPYKATKVCFLSSGWPKSWPPTAIFFFFFFLNTEMFAHNIFFFIEKKKKRVPVGANMAPGRSTRNKLFFKGCRR